MAEQEEPDGFAVVEILGTTLKHGKRHYKVRWADSWEPEENLAGCPQMIEDFWKKNKSEKRSKGSITRNKRKRTRQLRGDTPPASPPPNNNDTDSSDESDDSDDQPLGKTNKRKQRTKKNKRPRVESTSSSGDARHQGGEERAEENSLDNEITENTTSLGNSNQQEKLQAPMIGFGDQETSTDMNIDNEPTFDDTGEPPPIEEINAPNSSTTQRPTTPSISPVDNNIQPPPIEEINAGAPQIHYQKETSKDGNEEEEPTMQQLAQISNDSLLPLDTPVCQASSFRVKDTSPNSTSAQKTENQPPFAITTAATSTSTTFSSLTRANQRLAASNNRQNCIDVDEVYTDDVTSKILEEKPVVVKKEPLSEPEDEELSFKRTAKIKAGFTIRKLAEKELDTQESSDSNEEEEEYVQQPDEDDQDDISADDSNGTSRGEEQQRVNSAMPASSFQSAMDTLLTLNVTTVQSQQHQRISSFTNTKAPTTTTIKSFRCPTGAITNTFASIRPTLITSTTSCGSASTIVSFQSRPLPVPKGPVPDDNPEMARTFERFQKWSQFQQKELLTVSIKAVAKQVFTSKETSDGSIKTRINNWLTDRIRKKFGRQPGNAILNHPTYSQIVDNLAAKVFEAVKHIFKQSGTTDQKQDQGPQLVALSSGSNVPQPRPSNLQQPQGSHQRHPLPNILRPRQPPTPPAQHPTQQLQQHPISQLQQLSQQPRSVAMCPIPIAVDPQLPPYDLNDPQTQMQSQVMHRFASVHQQLNLQHLYTDPRLIPGSQPALYHNAHFQPIPGARPIGPIHSQQQPIQSIGIRMGQTSIRAQQPRLTHLNIQQPSQSGIRVGLSPDGTQQRVRYPGVFPTQQRNIQTSQIVTGTNQHSRENNPQRINTSLASQQPNRHQVNIMRGTHPTSPPANQQLPRPSFTAVRHPSPPSGGSNQQQLLNHQNQQQLPQRTQYSSANHAQLPQRTQYSSANHAQQRHPFPLITNNPQNSRSSIYTQGPTSMIKTARPQGSAQFNQRLPTQQNQNQNRFPRPNPQQAQVVQQQTHFHPRVVNFGKLHSFLINDLMGELTNLSTECQSSTHQQSSQAVQPVLNITQEQRSPQSFQQQPPTISHRTPTSQIVTSYKTLQKQPHESLSQRVQPVPAQILKHVTPTSQSQAPPSSTQQTPPVTSQQAPTATTVKTNQQIFQPPSTSSLRTIATTIVSESQQQSSSTTTSTGPRIKHTNPTASIKRYIPRKSFKGPALSFQDRQYEAGEMTPALRDDFMIPSIPPISFPEMPEEEENPLEFSDIISPSSPRANDIPIDTSSSNEKKTTSEKQESKDPGEPVMAMETDPSNLDIETDLTDQTDNISAPTTISQSPSKPQSKYLEATPMSLELESSSITDKDTATILASDSQLSSSEESQCMDEPIQSPGQPPIMAMEVDESESAFSSGKTNVVVNSTVIDNELLTKSKDSDTELFENKTADIFSTIKESNKDRNIPSDAEMSENKTADTSSTIEESNKDRNVHSDAEMSENTFADTSSTIKESNKDRNIPSDTEMSENTTQESSANTSSATEESNKTDKDLNVAASEPQPPSTKTSESNKDDCQKDEKELLEESKATEDDETEITDQEALAIAGCLGLDPSDDNPEPDNEIQSTERVGQETEGVDQETEGSDQATERKDQATEGVDQTDSPKDDSDDEITIINSKSTPVPERKPPAERVGGSGLSFTPEEEDVPHSVTSYIKRHYQSILDMVGDKRSSLGPKLHLHSDGSIEISLKEGGYIRIRYKDLVRADHERKARLRQAANTSAGSALRARNAVVLIDEPTTSAATDNTDKLDGSKDTMSDSTHSGASKKTNTESKRFGPGLIKKEKSPNRNTEKNETLLMKNSDRTSSEQDPTPVGDVIMTDTQTGNSNDSTSATPSTNTVTKADSNDKNRSVNKDSGSISTTIKDKTGIKTSNKSDENITTKQTQNLNKSNENSSSRNDIQNNERTQNMVDDIDLTKASKQENLKFDIKGSSTSQNSDKVNLAINTSKDTLKSNDESSTKSGGNNSLSNETLSNTDNSDSDPEHRNVDKKDSSKVFFSKDQTRNSTENHSGSDIKNKDHTTDEHISKENLNELNNSPVMNENELLDFDDSDCNEEDMDDKLLTEDQLLGNDDEDDVEMSGSTRQSDTSKPEKSENLNIEKKDFVSKTEITKSCQETNEVAAGIRITRIIDTEVKKSAVAASTGELSSNSSKSIAQGSGTVESSNQELNRTNMDTSGSKVTEPKLDSKTMISTTVDSLELDFETDQIASSPNLKSWEPNLNIDSTPTKNQSDVNKNIQSDSSKFDHVTSRNQSERSKSVDRKKQSSSSSKFKGVNLPFL